ncbi:diguanylate cyclase [Pseudomonadota bacterium]|nr:diguanylate cyclase [Pseudomonadota bacterium]
MRDRLTGTAMRHLGQYSSRRYRYIGPTYDYSDAANHITISTGVATISPSKTDDVKSVVKSLIQAADKALYLSKKYGRNQVSAEQE